MERSGTNAAWRPMKPQIATMSCVPLLDHIAVKDNKVEDARETDQLGIQMKELSRLSQNSVASHAELRGQMEQIKAQLQSTAETTKHQTSSVSTELANIRQELSKSQRAMQDKISQRDMQDKMSHGHTENISTELASLRNELLKCQNSIQSKLEQQPPLADCPDLPAQVALALRPLILEDIMMSKMVSGYGKFSPTSVASEHSHGVMCSPQSHRSFSPEPEGGEHSARPRCV